MDSKELGDGFLPLCKIYGTKLHQCMSSILTEIRFFIWSRNLTLNMESSCFPLQRHWHWFDKNYMNDPGSVSRLMTSIPWPVPLLYALLGQLQYMYFSSSIAFRTRLKILCMQDSGKDDSYRIEVKDKSLSSHWVMIPEITSASRADCCTSFILLKHLHTSRLSCF